MSSKQVPEGALRGKVEGRGLRDARKAACEVLSDCVCVKTIRGRWELERKRGGQELKVSNVPLGTQWEKALKLPCPSSVSSRIRCK